MLTSSFSATQQMDIMLCTNAGRCWGSGSLLPQNNVLHWFIGVISIYNSARLRVAAWKVPVYRGPTLRMSASCPLCRMHSICNQYSGIDPSIYIMVQTRAPLNRLPHALVTRGLMTEEQCMHCVATSTTSLQTFIELSQCKIHILAGVVNSAGCWHYILSNRASLKPSTTCSNHLTRASQLRFHVSNWIWTQFYVCTKESNWDF